jgi:hypothetical protein
MIKKITTPYIILFLLLGYAYYFVELPEYQNAISENNRVFFLRDFKPVRIETENISLTYNVENNIWSSSVISQSKLNQFKIIDFTKRLKKIRIDHTFSSKPPEIEFNYSFKIANSNNEESVVEIGGKQLFSEKYYLRYKAHNKTEEIYLVIDESPQVEIIPDELFNRNPFKRLEVIKFITADYKKFFKLSIASPGIHSAKFTKEYGPSFHINFDTNEVISSRRNTYSFDSRKVSNWKNEFVHLEADEIKTINNTNFIDKKKIGKIIIEGKSSRNEYEVFIPLKRTQKNMLLKEIGNSEYVMHINPRKLKILFPYLQDFIEKKIIPLNQVDNVDLVITTEEKNKYKIKALLKNDMLSIETSVVDERKISELMILTKIFFQDADYLSFGRAMTIIADKEIDVKFNDMNFSIGHAHGVVEIFDRNKQVSFFYRDKNLNQVFDKISL